MKKQNVRTLSFIVSTFTYLLIGAAIFDALESQTEETIKNDLESTEIDYKAKYNISNDEYKTLEDIVIKYHPYRKFPQWKFTGAFYFSLTVITTIGYGHSTPQTIPGKSFCMFYAIIGIPLCLVMFQSVGERLNYFASFCIQLVKKCIRFKNTEVNQTEMVCVAGALSFLVITGGAAMFSHYEGWTYFNAIYYCVITLTTIGFGDYVERNDLSNTVYVILSFTFILFGLTVVASSINLLVLKFLTMNTEDERREEYTKKVQQNQNIRFSSTDLLNVVNGNVICTYEPSDLEELRRENSIRFCFWKRNSFCVSFKRQFPFIEWKAKSSDEIDQNSMYTLGKIKHNKMENYEKYLINKTDSVSFDSSNNPNAIERKRVLCTFCLNNNSKNQKSHYTIRRAPGKISHLLIANSITDANAKTKPVESPKICLPKTSDSVLDMTNSFENKTELQKRNSFTKPSLNYDINVYIDDDNDQEDYLTVTNATILTTLTKFGQNNSDNRLKNLEQKQSTPIEPNSDINFNFLSANYLSTASIKKTSNNDLSSQNMTEYDISYDKSRLDDESSLNDADDMLSSSKKFFV